MHLKEYLLTELSAKQKLIAISVAAGLVAGVFIGRSLPWHGSFHKCVVREARGLPTEAISDVRYYCRDEYPLQVREAVPAADAMAAPDAMATMEAVPAPEAPPAY